MFVWKDIAWWYWLLTDLLLSVGLAGYRWGYTAVIALCLVQVVHFWARERSVDAFPVQLRVWYLAILIAGQHPALGVLNGLQLAGTTVSLVWDYCLLSRLVALLPGNRQVTLSRSLIARVLLAPPVAGSILEYVRAEPAERPTYHKVGALQPKTGGLNHE